MYQNVARTLSSMKCGSGGLILRYSEWFKERGLRWSDRSPESDVGDMALAFGYGAAEFFIAHRLTI